MKHQKHSLNGRAVLRRIAMLVGLALLPAMLLWLLLGPAGLVGGSAACTATGWASQTMQIAASSSRLGD